jgi:hypothetical protein
MKIGEHEFNINQEHYVAGDIGENAMKYPRLSSFIDVYICNKTGLSSMYPGYHFDFKVVQYNNFDSGLASIYKLKITKTL